jgi:fatty-acyl-CoA synthase
MNDTDARRRNHWVSHIARHAHEKPGGVYLRFEGGSVTWAQIHERISGLAAALRERGVRAGDRVAIMMTNRPEFLETMFAANAIGAIVVPVNFRLAPDEIAYILTDSGASLLVVEEATAAAAASARAACAHEIGFVSTGHAEGADPYFPAGSGPAGSGPAGSGPAGSGPAGSGPAGSGPAGSGPAEPPAVDVPEDSPALIMYTSGTTGRPRARC